MTRQEMIADRNAKIAELRAGGLSTERIAARVGVSKSKVWHVTAKIGSGRQGLWSEERVELLKKLWNSGTSAGHIVGELGNVTRNAVIGKIHRLGLSKRTTTSRMKKHKPRRVKEPAPMPPPRVKPLRIPGALFTAEPLPDARTPLEGAKLVSFEDLEQNHCRWMHGNRYCGCPNVHGTSYCSEHARLAYQSNKAPTGREFVLLQRMGSAVA